MSERGVVTSVSECANVPPVTMQGREGYIWDGTDLEIGFFSCLSEPGNRGWNLAFGRSI